MCVCVFMLIQLDETFSVVLSSHSTPPSRLGEHRAVNITIRRNDDPFGVIEFIQSGLMATIKESKEDDTHSGSPSENNDTFPSSRETVAKHRK